MDAWYSVMSMGFGYLSALLIFLIVLISVRKTAADHRIYKRVVRDKKQVAYAGELTVRSGSAKRLSAGTVLSVPYEGTIGAASGCDVVLSIRKLHHRSAFFWAEHGSLHLVPVQRDTILVDGDVLRPGDEAVMSSGAILSVNGVEMTLKMYDDSRASDGPAGPYVTKARRVLVHQGRGKGIGSIGSTKEARGKRNGKKREGVE